MKEDDYIGSDRDIRRFASWYRKELLKSLEEKDRGGDLTARERFGLASLSSGNYKVGSDNLDAACEVIRSSRMPVIRRLLELDQETLTGCVREFATKRDDQEEAERLSASIAWLSDVRTMKL